MKILILSNIEASGEWVGTQTLLTGLKKKSKNVKLYLVAYGKKMLLLDKNIFEQIILIDKFLPKPPFRYYKQIFTEILQVRESVRKLLKKNVRFDLAVSTDPSLLLASLTLRASFRSIYWFHGFRTYYFFNIKNFDPYIFIRKYLERLAFLLSSWIIVPSQFAKKMLQKELSIFSRLKKISIIPDIPRIEFIRRFTLGELQEFRKKFNLPNNKKILVFSGIIDPRKGLIELLKSFIFIKKRCKDVIVVLAYLPSISDKKYLERMQGFISHNNLKSDVKMLANLNISDLAKLYQTSYCALLPSNFETYGLFIHESILSLLPIFATNVGASSKLLKNVDRFFILKNNSVSTISDSLNDFFSKPASWHEKIRKKMIQSSHDLDFEGPINRLNKLFTQP